MLANWVQETTATTGTGTITLGGAYDGSYVTVNDRYRDGDIVPYTIKDGNNRETGLGTFASSGTTLARTSVKETLVSGVLDNTNPTAINLSGSAVVAIGPSAIEQLYSIPYAQGIGTSSCGLPHAFAGGFGAATLTVAADREYSYPFYVAVADTYNGLIIYVAATGTATKGRISLRQMPYTSGALFGDIIVETGDIDVTVTGHIATSIAATPLDAGWYVMSAIFDGTAGIFSYASTDLNRVLSPWGTSGGNRCETVAAVSWEDFASGWTTMPVPTRTSPQYVAAMPAVRLSKT